MATSALSQPFITNSGDLRTRGVSAAWIKRGLVALILVYAFVARTDHLRQPFADAFSWRQASTAMMAWNFYQHSANIFFPAINWSGPEPAYTGREFQTVTYLAALLYRVFGPDEWIGRAISAAFGVWGVFAFFRLTRRVWDETRAYAAALVLALMPGAVFIDRSFLPDPAMLALTITTVWVYVTYLQTNQRRYLLLTGVVGVIAFLTKLPGIVTIAPMIYATVVILRQQNRLNAQSLRPILGMLLLALIPISAYYAWAVYLGTHYPPYHVAGGGNWVTSHGFMRWVNQGYFLKESFDRFSYWLWSAPVVALAGLGMIFSPGADREVETSSSDTDFKAPWLFHFWGIGCLLLYLVGAKELNDNPWNFHIFNPVGAALAGQGLILIMAGQLTWRVPSRLQLMPIGPAIRFTLVLAFLVLHGRTLFDVMSKGYAMNGVRMGRALERLSKPGDTVVTIADDVGDPISIYYSRRRGWVFPPAHQQKVWPAWSVFPPDDSLSITMFEELRAEGADWLGIVANPKDDTPDRREFWKHHPQLVAHFNQTCEFVEKTDYWVIYRIRSPFELAQQKPATQPVLSSAE